MKAGRGRPKNKGTHAGSGRGNVKHKKNADPSSPLLCEPLSEPANVTRSTRGRPKKKGTHAGSGRGGRPKKKGTHAGSGRGNIKHKKNDDPYSPLLYEPLSEPANVTCSTRYNLSTTSSTVDDSENVFDNVQLLSKPISEPVNVTRSSSNNTTNISSTDDNSHNVILSASDLSNIIEDHFCSKEYVSYGMKVMLNQFSELIQEEIKKTVDKVCQCSERNSSLRKNYIEEILRNELDVNKWKTSFVRKKIILSKININVSVTIIWIH